MLNVFVVRLFIVLFLFTCIFNLIITEVIYICKQKLDVWKTWKLQKTSKTFKKNLSGLVTDIEVKTTRKFPTNALTFFK